MPTDFDERARTWDDDPAKRDRAQAVAEAVRRTVGVDPSTSVLEYGAGTGLLSQALAADVGAITLAEPSEGMRSVIAEKVAAGALPADVRVWGLDLATDPVPDERFDLVVTVLTLHHIPDLSPVLEAMASLVAEQGRLCIVDLEKEDGSFHRNDPDFDGHDGFSRESLARRLRAAGFADVRFEPCYEIDKHGETYPLFLAVCRHDAS